MRTNVPQYDFPVHQEHTVEINGQRMSMVDSQSLRRVLMSIHSRINVLTGAAPNGVTFKGAAHMGGNVINGGVNSAKPTPDEFATIGHLRGTYKAQSVLTPMIPKSGTAPVVLTWTTPFDDANYIPQAQILEGTGSAATLSVHHVQSVTAKQVIVIVVNADTTTAHSGTLLVTAQAG